MAKLALNTIYKVQPLTQQQNYPPIEIKGGTVNVYASVSETKPANLAAMSVASDDMSIDGIKTLVSRVRWIAFESASGSPTVEDNGVVMGE